MYRWFEQSRNNYNKWNFQAIRALQYISCTGWWLSLFLGHTLSIAKPHLYIWIVCIYSTVSRIYRSKRIRTTTRNRPREEQSRSGRDKPATETSVLSLSFFFIFFAFSSREEISPLASSTYLPAHVLEEGAQPGLPSRLAAAWSCNHIISALKSFVVSASFHYYHLYTKDWSRHVRDDCLRARSPLYDYCYIYTCTPFPYTQPALRKINIERIRKGRRQ